MSDTETWDDDDVIGLSVDFSYTHVKTIRGMRDSLGGQAGMGPPLEPDEEIGYWEVEAVRLYDVELDLVHLDVSDHYDSEEELVGEVSEQVTKLIHEQLGHEPNPYARSVPEDKMKQEDMFKDMPGEGKLT